MEAGLTPGKFKLTAMAARAAVIIAAELRRIRPEARPLQRVVGFFDEVLGSRLVAVNESIRAEWIAEMKRELDLDADMLLEELPAADE